MLAGFSPESQSAQADGSASVTSTAGYALREQEAPGTPGLRPAARDSVMSQRDGALQLLQQVISRVGTRLDVNTVLQETADAMVYLMGYETALVFLLDEEGREEPALRAQAICSRRNIRSRIEALPGHSLTSLE